MDENAFFTEQHADSPASLNPSFHCSFFDMILRENGISTLFAFLSIIDGINGSILSDESESVTLLLLLSSESWKLRDKSSILLENSSSEEEEELLKLALQVKFNFVEDERGRSQDRDLWRRVGCALNRLDRSGLVSESWLKEGYEIAEARVWEEWRRTGLDQCKQVEATFIFILIGF